MRRVALVCLIAVATGAGCAAGSNQVLGTWQMVSFTEEGTTFVVEEDVNTRHAVYIDFGEHITGSAGCNGFGSGGTEGYTFTAGRLDPGEIVSEAALCVPERLMAAETALKGMLWAGRAIEVTFREDTMSWRLDGEVITWRSIDGPPQPPTLPPQTSFGRLDCGDREVVREQTPAVGDSLASFEASGAELVAGVPGVAEVLRDDPQSLVWFGMDASGEVVVAVSFEDVVPEMFSIWTCP